MEITSQVYTYKELKEGLDLGRDDYGIAAMCSRSLQDAFKANPNIIDEESPFMYIGRVDGIAAGIGMWFPSKVKAGDEYINSTGGSTLEVYEAFRKYEFGADILLYPTYTEGFNFLLFAGVTDQAMQLYKKLKYTVFEYPRAMRICNCRSILESKGFNSVLLKLFTYITNSFLKTWYSIASKFSSTQKEYSIKQLLTVPDWIEDMSLNDGHQYMEVHDKKWFQWNLSYNLHGEKDDIQSLYGVFEGETPVAFFMTKERFRSVAGGKLKNVVIGSIMEWGIDRQSVLNESDLYRMAVNTFSKKVDIIEFATDDIKTVNRMKLHGFIPYGAAHIVLKDLTKKHKGAKDISKWRIRFAYSDVFLT